MSNLGLIAAILSADIDDLDVTNHQETAEQRSIIYMQVVLYSVAALSGFRFIGAMWFLVLRLVSRRMVVSYEKYVLTQPHRFEVFSSVRLGSGT